MTVVAGKAAGAIPSAEREKGERMIRLVFGIILGAIMVIFAFQNRELVTIDFLAWQITLTRAFMVILVLLAGMIIGWLTGSVSRISRRKR